MWNRYACCPKNQTNNIIPEPNTLKLELWGFPYRTIPAWFTENGERMVHVDFKCNHKLGYYMWKFYKKIDDHNISVYLSTSDDIMPLIHVNEKEGICSRVSTHNGYTLWLVKGE